MNQSMSAQSQQSEVQNRLKTLADLKKIAPGFDGSENQYYFFKQALTGFFKRHHIEDDEALAVEVAINACTDKAQRYLSTIPDVVDTMAEFWDHMDQRFGEGEYTRVQKYRALRQKDNESIRAFADRVQEHAYGLEMPTSLLSIHFIDNLKERSIIRRALANDLGKYTTLQSLAEAAQEALNSHTAYDKKPFEKKTFTSK